jgi:hypothetical protein
MDSCYSLGSTYANGWVTTASQVDSFGFAGEITDFAFLQGAATVEVNGTEVDPENFTLPNEIVLKGTGNQTTTYEFAISGDVEEAPSIGSLEESDTVDGGTITGEVTGDVDAYHFSGDLLKLYVDGDAALNFEDNDG